MVTRRILLLMIGLFIAASSLITAKVGLAQATGWQIQTADSTADSTGDASGNPSIITDSNGKAYISYHLQVGAFHKIKFATNRTGTWTNEILSSVSFHQYGIASSIAFQNDKVYICYHFVSGVPSAGSPNKRLQLWTKDLTTATATVVVVDEGGPGGALPIVGKGCSIAMDSLGGFHISYFDSTNYNFKYAYRASASAPFSLTTIASTGINYIPEARLAVTPQGEVHLAYYEAGSSTTEIIPTLDLRHAIKTAGGTFATELIDSTGNVGEYNDIAIDSQGKVHISYLDETGITPVIKYATNRSGSWVVIPLDTASFSSVVVSGETAHFFYPVSSGGTTFVRHATLSFGSSSPSFEDIDQFAGSFNSAAVASAVDPQGGLHVAYYDPINKNLKYAFKAPPPPPPPPPPPGSGVSPEEPASPEAPTTGTTGVTTSQGAESTQPSAQPPQTSGGGESGPFGCSLILRP